ncbi:histidine phosphatase family protein [Ancylobacter radicis]|uniref:Histidine phosphatase family protein n=1 Tax=Ancylobacter radicis TaxID=2836179 RepID=A0ABS5RB58_9HYPH|nr:histidine phosphatase family protein [Ancylobacter radicis]MBS9478908.1 histidine phosphatase family protein [Ancylobacter radicis]
MHRRLILASIALLVSMTGLTRADEAVAWQALRAGGVVLFRHASAPGVGDPAGFRIGDCSTQRNLDAAGRAQARRIGETFARERVSVSRVETSRWCRATETAELAFPGKVVAEPVFDSFFQDRADEPAQTAAARRRLLDWRGPGALVVVAHQVNITALTGINLASGEGVVLRAEGGALKIVGRIRP